MKRDFRILLGLLLSATMIISCEQDDTESYDLSEQTSVSLSINVDDMESGTATRSSIDADDNDSISSEVKSLWIAQCNGTDDTSKVLMAHYVADVSVTNALDLTFIQSGRETTMVYIANVNQTIGEGDDVANLITTGMTLSELKALSPTLSAPTSADQLYTSGLVNEFSNTKYFVMNGYEVLKDGINSSTELTASLKRNAVKITINLLNQWYDSEINGVTLMSTADNTEYALWQYDFDAYATKGTPYPTTITTPIDHLETELSIAGDLFASDDKTVSINFYVPANMRGTNSSSTEEAAKPTYAPAGATYIVISAEDEYEFFYTYYLGANLIDDYNLMPNYHYTYDITFTGAGDLGGDVRIDATIVNDYSEENSSNCYIINGSDDYLVKYYIPIEERITDFWTNYDSNATYTASALTAALANCTYDILWTDNDSDPFDKGTDQIDQIEINKVDRDGKQCFEVVVPKSFDNWGNVLVAVRDSGNEDSESNILWSWHLWITDYNPYSNIVKVDDNYYTVDGGYLHRYDDASGQDPAIWGSGGTYDGKYIMDRNIGAKVAKATYRSGEQGLYYQYGRKDPFYYITYNTYSANLADGPKGLDYSVKNPTTFITGDSGSSIYNWCKEDTDTSYTWNDKKAPYSATSPRKSIFDPSPYGYCVPIKDIWNGDVFNKPISTFTRPYNYYYYYGYYTIIGMCSVDDNSAYCSSTLYDKDNSYIFYQAYTYGIGSYVNASYIDDGFYRVCGCLVRPIQE